MVSCGPDVQNCNYTHMAYFTDYRGDFSKPCFGKDTLYSFLYNNPEYSKFKTIVDRAKMTGQLGNSEANFTLFVPPNEVLKNIPEDYFTYMDDGLARQILDTSTMNRKIYGKLLLSSPVAYYATRDNIMKLYVTNISGKTRINNCASVIKYDIEFSNGLVHLVDNILTPNMDHFMT